MTYSTAHKTARMTTTRDRLNGGALLLMVAMSDVDDPQDDAGVHLQRYMLQGDLRAGANLRLFGQHHGG